MDFDQIQSLVREHLGLLEVTAVAIAQSKDRASKFLVMQAILSNHIKSIQDAKVKASTIEKATYAQAMLGASGKNVTENKIMAEAEPNYSAARETLEFVDSELNWTKQHFDIFNNAHILFRQFSKE